MDAKEYLEQAQRLDLRIKSRVKERAELMELITSLTSPQMSEKVVSSPSGDPQFLKQLERIWELDAVISDDLDLLIDLKLQVNDVLNSLKDARKQLVLRYIYINDYPVVKIAEMMDMTRKTITRWHNEGLEQLKLPENPIMI